MALPATGSTISMTDINNYFVGGGFASSFTISVLGTYIGITAGATISMSSSFGGYYFPTLASRTPGSALHGYIVIPGYGTSVGTGNNPEGTTTAYPAGGSWGMALAMTDDFIIAGDNGARGGQNSNLGIGQAYIIDRNALTYIQLIDSPYQGNSSLLERVSRFGSSVGLGNAGSTLYAVVLNGKFQNPGNNLYAPKICVYSSTNNFQTIALHKIIDMATNDSNSTVLDNYHMSVRGDYVVIGDENYNSGRGTVRFCQLSTATTSMTEIFYGSNYYAGVAVDINPTTGNITVGGNKSLTQGPTTYAVNGFSQRHSITTSATSQLKQGYQYAGGASNNQNFYYGRGVADAGDYYAVASGGDDYNGYSDVGRVRIFNANTGGTIATINNPIPNSSSGGPGQWAAHNLRGNANGQIAVLWGNIYDSTVLVCKIYNASNGNELFSRPSPLDSTSAGNNHWRYFDSAMAISTSYVALTAGVSGFGNQRIYVY